MKYMQLLFRMMIDWNENVCHLAYLQKYENNIWKG